MMILHSTIGLYTPLPPPEAWTSAKRDCVQFSTSYDFGSSYYIGKTQNAGIKISSRFRCYSYSSGVSGGPSIFNRFFRIIKSYANAILSSFEDPEKIIEQAVIEMNNDLIRMRQATAQVLASQKKLENKYQTAYRASVDWYNRAKLAVHKGEEDLAREALKRKKLFAENADSLKAQLDQQETVVQNLLSNTRILESKIQEAKSKKDTLKARAQSAKTANKLNAILGGVDTSSALSAFDKMEEKVLTLETEAEATGQLATDELDGKFSLLERSSVDDDLEDLKRSLSASSLRAQLPPGRTVKGSAPLVIDQEIEFEINKLKQKEKSF